MKSSWGRVWLTHCHTVHGLLYAVYLRPNAFLAHATVDGLLTKGTLAVRRARSHKAVQRVHVAPQHAWEPVTVCCSHFSREPTEHSSASTHEDTLAHARAIGHTMRASEHRDCQRGAHESPSVLMADSVTQVGITQKLVRCFSSSCVHPASLVIRPGCRALTDQPLVFSCRYGAYQSSEPSCPPAWRQHSLYSALAARALCCLGWGCVKGFAGWPKRAYRRKL